MSCSAQSVGPSVCCNGLAYHSAVHGADSGGIANLVAFCATRQAHSLAASPGARATRGKQGSVRRPYLRDLDRVKVRKTDNTGKAYSEDAPAHGSVSEFLDKVNNDPEWFPGKHNGVKRGPQPRLTISKRRRIAASAMSQKGEGYEPSVEVTIAKCPAATHNPQTRRPFCDEVIRKVFVEDCYDFDPESPWKLQYPLQKVFLPDKVKEHRVRMVDEIEALPNSSDAGWWYRYVVWFDPCQSIVARTRQQYDRMRRAERGNQKKIYL